jgi:dihydroorotase
MRLISPLDMHLHLRDGDMLRQVAPLSSKDFAGALIMPNLVPPITTIEALLGYRDRVASACGREVFEPYMTLFFRADYTPKFLEEARAHITAIKLYPSGITTNSEGGVSDMDTKSLATVLHAMEELGIPLCVHGETNGFVMDREREFGAVYERLAREFPRLKIIMEHITDRHSVELLDRYENLHATITLHHLLITLDDVAGGGLRPHLFCKPIAKRPEDRSALLNAALTAHPKVMFGSDSAPHPVHKKECCGCAAGVFSAPVILPALAELFESHNATANLQAFISDNARQIYGITPPDKLITLEKKEWQVPEKYGEVVPMFAGETMQWGVVG